MLKYMCLKVESPADASAGLFWLFDRRDVTFRIAPESLTLPALPTDRFKVGLPFIDPVQPVGSVLAAGPGAFCAPRHFYSWHRGT